MAAFHDVRFPLSIALGAVGGPERRTEIVSLANGREERNSPWSRARRRWDAGVGVTSLDDLHALVAFFEARRGRLHGFRWRDPVDWKSCAPSASASPLDQALGTGDGAATAFQLVKTYADAGGDAVRDIVKPIAGTVRVAVDGVELLEGTDFSVDGADGRVTLVAPPANGAAVTAGFEFDVPVRFDVDRLDIAVDAFDAGTAPHVPVVELIV